MEHKSIYLLFMLLFGLQSMAQKNSKELVLKRNDDISFNREFELFRVVHRWNYSIKPDYYDFNLNLVDSNEFVKFKPEWKPLDELGGEQRKSRMSFPSVRLGEMKNILTHSYHMYDDEELIGYYSIHYFSKNRMAYTSTDELYMVISTYDTAFQVLKHKDFHFPIIYRKELSDMSSNCYFFRNIIYMGNRQWMIDTFSEVIFIDEDFKVFDRYKWGEPVNTVGVPDAFKYIFQKRIYFIKKDPKFVQKRCPDGPTNCGVDRDLRGWANYQLYWAGGKTFVRLEILGEAFFAVF